MLSPHNEKEAILFCWQYMKINEHWKILFINFAETKKKHWTKWASPQSSARNKYIHEPFNIVLG